MKTHDNKPKLLVQLRETLRRKHYSRRTEQAYGAWNRRFILFHNTRHPAERGAPEIEQFLTALAVEQHVAARPQNQALHALLFLYKEVLGIDLPWLNDIRRANNRRNCPWC
jgi:Phage integrase, N-terminal SAM-like domain